MQATVSYEYLCGECRSSYCKCWPTCLTEKLMFFPNQRASEGTHTGSGSGTVELSELRLPLAIRLLVYDDLRLRSSRPVRDSS